MTAATLRLKMSISSVKLLCAPTGEISAEEIELQAVYGPEGTANAQWSQWTPYARLFMTINNPDAFGKVRPGQFYFVDLIPTDQAAS